MSFSPLTKSWLSYAWQYLYNFPSNSEEFPLPLAKSFKDLWRKEKHRRFKEWKKCYSRDTKINFSSTRSRGYMVNGTKQHLIFVFITEPNKVGWKTQLYSNLHTDTYKKFAMSSVYRIRKLWKSVQNRVFLLPYDNESFKLEVKRQW